MLPLSYNFEWIVQEFQLTLVHLGIKQVLYVSYTLV